MSQPCAIFDESSLIRKLEKQRITLEEKEFLISQLNNGLSVDDVIRKYRLSQDLVRHIKNEELRKQRKELKELQDEVCANFCYSYAWPESDFRRQLRIDVSRSNRISAAAAETSDFANILTSFQRATSSLNIPEDAVAKKDISSSQTSCRILAKKFGIQPHIVDFVQRARSYTTHKWPSSDLPIPNYRSYPQIFPSWEQTVLPDRLDTIRQFLSPSCVKQYRPTLKCGEITWEEDYFVGKSNVSIITEPLRTPADVMRTLISRRISLLDNPSYDALGRTDVDASTHGYIFKRFSEQMLVVWTPHFSDFIVPGVPYAPAQPVEENCSSSVPPHSIPQSSKGNLSMESELSMKVQYGCMYVLYVYWQL